MTYRLTYWNKRGRGEQIRLLCQALDIPYEDVHITRDELAELQKQGPELLYFGSIPMLEDGDFKLCQGPVIMSYLASKHGFAPTDPQLAAKADAIVLGAEDLRIGYFGLFGPDAEQKQRAFVEGRWQQRWLPSFEGLLSQGESQEYFVGKGWTHADAAVWDAIDGMVTWVSGATLDGFPLLQAHRAAFAARVQSYLDSDRRPKG